LRTKLGQGGLVVRHHGDVDDYTALGRLSRAVYIAARAGAVDCTAAFDLASSWLEERPHDQDATELATLSAECAETSQPRMAEIALSLLAAAGFSPGFNEEPGWLACLEDAMRLVNRDMAATGIRQACHLRVYDDERFTNNGNAGVETRDGWPSSDAQGIDPVCGADPVDALLAVAEDAQDALMHALWAAWPACPAHRLGLHARDHQDAAVWWCAGDGGHAVAAIGEWQGR
jgi:hypothetical protein